jgi:hypothetical protein
MLKKSFKSKAFDQFLRIKIYSGFFSSSPKRNYPENISVFYGSLQLSSVPAIVRLPCHHHGSSADSGKVRRAPPFEWKSSFP